LRIFIASSRESLDLVHEIEVWLEEQGHESVPWDKPGLFMPGEQTFKTLMEISRNVDAAVFVFSADDKVWYRGDTVPQPRDNILIEYGLFGGALGPSKAIIRSLLDNWPFKVKGEKR
jgi:predicted nucleotide-binding protein